MVELYYEINLYVSLLLLAAYIFIYHKHFDVHITAIFLLVPVNNLGYLLYGHSQSLETALAANKITYTGGLYMMFDIMLIVFSLCNISLNRWIRLAFMTASSVVYISTLTIGEETYFYKSVTFERVDGVSMLHKDYNYMHTAFYALILIYLFCSIGAMVYSYFKKKQVSRRLIQLLLVPVLICVFFFFGIRNFRGAELIPVSYNLALISYLLIVHRLCLYDVTDTAIDSLVETGDTGFASFDFKFRYLGSNETARTILTDLGDLTVDKPIKGIGSLDDTALVWLGEYESDNTKDKFFYKKDDRIYLVTISFLYDGKHKRGYQFFVTDDTKNQQYISLINRYNSDLQQQVAEKTRHIVEMHDNLVISMATMVESRDNSTGGHIKRTSEGVRILIDEIKRDGSISLSEEFCKEIIKAAPMHDLGKIAVDDAILRKPGRFTDDEFEKMKVHAAEGARIVHEILSGTDDKYFMTIAENVAHYHHERWDGSGYPEGLKGEQIPIEARIMAIADVYDALVSKRVYKERMSFEQADKIIMEGMGRHFDRSLEHIYVNARPKLEEYYMGLDEG